MVFQIQQLYSHNWDSSTCSGVMNGLADWHGISLSLSLVMMTTRTERNSGFNFEASFALIISHYRSDYYLATIR